LILADEPTGHLDTESGVEVMGIIQDLNRGQGITVLIVTHDPFIARHTRRIIRIQDGRIVDDSRVAEPLIAGESERPTGMGIEEALVGAGT
jgi:putative ABC transport system ATP-binding protein